MAQTAINQRLARLEQQYQRGPAVQMTKGQRDGIVRRFITQGDFSVLLTNESEPHRRAVFEAAMRADN